MKMKNSFNTKIFLFGAIFLCAAFLRPNTAFAQTDDPLLKTTRVLWKSVGGFASLIDLLNSQTSSQSVKNNKKLSISNNGSIFYRPGRTELFRIRVQNAPAQELEIWRVSVEGSEPIRLIANEATKKGSDIIIAPPVWLDDPIYEVSFPDARLNEKRELIITAEKTTREADPFYREKVLREAADSISKGDWVERSLNLWKQSEPGDKARVLYRKQISALPWNENANEPEFVKFYRRAILERDLIDFRNEQTNNSLRLAADSEPMPPVLTADKTEYALGSKFSIKVNGSKAIRITARIPFDSASLSDVRLYYLDVFLDDKAFERIYFDSRVDGCRYAVGGQNQLVGRRRTETLIIPPGSHNLRIESSAPVFISLSTAENRKSLRQALSGDKLEDNFRRSLDAANQRLVSSPADDYARFVYAAALMNQGRGEEASAHLEQLLTQQTDDVFKTYAALMLARGLFEAGNFEAALSALPKFDVKKNPFEPKISINSAVQIDALKERARILRRLDRHAEAAEVLAAASTLDPLSADLPQMAGEALKWSQEPSSSNPAVLAQFDRALILNPANSGLKTERQRAWFDFTYWQSQLPSRAATGAAFTVLDAIPNRRPTNDFVSNNDEQTANPACGAGQNASEFQAQTANQNRFFEIKPNVNQKIDLTKALPSPGNDSARVRLRVSAAACPLPFELSIVTDEREVLRPMIYKADQTIEFNLSNTVHALRLEGCPQTALASGAACAGFFINQVPITDTGEVNVPVQIVERRYYNFSVEQSGRIEFVTRDDPNPTIGRIFLRDVDEAGGNPRGAAGFSGTVSINGKIVERFSSQNSAATQTSQNGNAGNWGFLFRVPAGRGVISITTDNMTGVKQLGVNLSLRSRRQDGAADLTEVSP
ncbi:MAG: hypothetical protein LC778_05320 [Acidobacteria bacterium]|nr:hypothetical protein [Acidobacteriota bacterium]